MSDLQKSINNDAISREEREKREETPGLGGEVMSSILDMLTPMKRSEGGSWICKSGAEKRNLDWKYKFVSHLNIEKKDHLGEITEGKVRGPCEHQYFLIR